MCKPTHYSSKRGFLYFFAATNCQQLFSASNIFLICSNLSADSTHDTCQIDVIMIDMLTQVRFSAHLTRTMTASLYGSSPQQRAHTLCIPWQKPWLLPSTVQVLYTARSYTILYLDRNHDRIPSTVQVLNSALVQDILTKTLVLCMCTVGRNLIWPELCGHHIRSFTTTREWSQ